MDPASETSLSLNNNLGDSSHVTFYGFHTSKTVSDTTFLLEPKSRILIDNERRLGANGLFDFAWVSNHFDSIKVVNGTRKSIKDFTNELEWTMERKDKSHWEYTLVIDDSDF